MLKLFTTLVNTSTEVKIFDTNRSVQFVQFSYRPASLREDVSILDIQINPYPDISNKSYNYYRAMHFSAKRGIAIACRLSVRNVEVL